VLFTSCEMVYKWPSRLVKNLLLNRKDSCVFIFSVLKLDYFNPRVPSCCPLLLLTNYFPSSSSLSDVDSLMYMQKVTKQNRKKQSVSPERNSDQLNKLHSRFDWRRNQLMWEFESAQSVFSVTLSHVKTH